MGTRQEQFSGTRDVREAHQIDIGQLEEYLLSHVEHFHGPLTVQQFKGGQSKVNPTSRHTSPDSPQFVNLNWCGDTTNRLVADEA